MRALPSWLLAGTLALGAVGLSVRNAKALIERWTRPQTQPVKQVGDWKSLLVGATLVGKAEAAVVLVVYWDYECGTCIDWGQRTELLVKKYQGALTVAYHAFPLDYHERGFATALASECADQLGAFESFHSALLAEADPLDSLAHERVSRATITDHVAFERCRNDPATAAKVNASRNEGRLRGITETPTFIMNGKLFTGIPWDYEKLVADQMTQSR